MSAPVAAGSVEQINAVTLAVADMARSVAFYREAGFPLLAGGARSGFTSLRAGTGFVSLQHDPDLPDQDGRWGRVIFFVDAVDATWARVSGSGLRPEQRPEDAAWGERFFHLRDPDGHELSFARPLG